MTSVVFICGVEMMAKTPEFKTVAEEVAFWETHSTANYWDESEEVHFEVELHKNLLKPNPLILTEKPAHCPQCQQPLADTTIEYLTQNQGHLVSIRDVPVCQCPNGHTYIIAEKFDLLVDLLEQEKQHQVKPVEMLHVPVFQLQPA